MWDEHDYTARWVQAFCAVFLALFVVADAWFVISNFGLFYGVSGTLLFFASVRVSWRCARYAITGKNNINRDGF